MNSHRSCSAVLTALALALSAGLAAPALAQTKTAPARAPRAIAAADAHAVDYRSSHWIVGRKVVNNNGEEVASVSDLILDRGSGRVEHVVITTGAILGYGGRAVAIPYGSFGWEKGEKDRLLLASTPEQLKQFPEFTPEAWKAMKQSKADDAFALRKKLAADAASPADPYSGNLDTVKKARVEGEITGVHRVRTSEYGEHLIVTVQTADGSAPRRIALGPSWFVNATPAAPMRGDKVVIDTLALPRDPDQLLVATHLRAGDRHLMLRDAGGKPAWALQSVESDGQSYSTPYSRFMLLSAVTGMKADARGEECGTVHEVILDRTSGEVAFLSIDPNQNFLGIGDTKRLIPWAVVTVPLDGPVRIDASKEMLLASAETPSDLATLNTGDRVERIYKAFDVDAPRLVAPAQPETARDTKDAWGAGGPIIRAVETGSVTTLTGSVLAVTDLRFDDGTAPARAVKVRVNDGDGAEEIVILGPVSYMANQRTICRPGDAISLEACRTTINGRQYWLARSVECMGRRTVMLDASNTPAWARP
ncbi:MAG TPA: PRC-barrel domain-containing protein [Phycisphaerales bacterium]|nr:PRC-barrel domain-containing protein [Phycisphaerales bacterium]